MTLLDDSRALSDLDPGGMLQQVAGLPAQLGWAAAVRAEVTHAVAPLRSAGRRTGALVCGMGGSAMGGDYAAAWCDAQGLRVQVHRGYGLPSWATSETLLVFSSYSGRTEETLSAYAAAPPEAAKICITTGGELHDRAAADGAPRIVLPAGLQPRAALGYSLVALLLALEAVGFLRRSAQAELEAAWHHLEELARELAPEVPEARNRAKQLARACAHRLTWIWTGNGVLEPVGRRWRAQWNENAKTLALCSVVPEMCHNEIMGPPLPAGVCKDTQILALADADDVSPVRRRMQLLDELLTPHVAGSSRVECRETEVLPRMLGATLLGDYISVYLAFLHAVDPTPVGRIETLKQRLQGT